MPASTRTFSLNAWCHRRPFAAGALRAAVEGVAATFGVSLESADIWLDETLGDGMTTTGRVRQPDLDHLTDVVGACAEVEVLFPPGGRLGSLRVSGRVPWRIGVAASGLDAACVRAAVTGLMEALGLTRAKDDA